jgi:hypothetical protein
MLHQCTAHAPGPCDPLGLWPQRDKRVADQRKRKQDLSITHKLSRHYESELNVGEARYSTP